MPIWHVSILKAGDMSFFFQESLPKNETMRKRRVVIADGKTAETAYQ